jgi:hypothetical protein
MAQWVWRLYANDTIEPVAAGKQTLEALEPTVTGAFYPTRGRPPLMIGIAPDELFIFCVAVRSDKPLPTTPEGVILVDIVIEELFV